MGIPYRVERIGYPVPESYRARNPLGQVPFLEDDQGAAITESVAMLLYIAGKYGPTPLLPGKDDPRFARVLQMTTFSEATLGSSINALLLDRFGLPEADRGSALQRATAARVSQQIDFVAHILDGNAYIAGNDITIADLSLAGSLALWSGALKGALPETVAPYLDRLTARPTYIRAAAANAPSAG
jgi:glutathione S-transferase